MSAGTIAPDAARLMLRVMFPSVPEATADAIVAASATFQPSLPPA